MGNTETADYNSNAMEKSQPINPLNLVKTYPDPQTDNGLVLKNTYLPEEVLVHILSFTKPEKVLRLSLVCKRWHRIVRSRELWFIIYERHYKKKPKKLPWFIYYCLFSTEFFDKNLLKNGNGENNFKHWIFNCNNNDFFKIEKEPIGADPLPEDIPDFNGHKSCFVTSYSRNNKEQRIQLNNNLLSIMLDYYKPNIYVSEWTAGRFDCGCVYMLTCKLIGDSEEILLERTIQNTVKQWEGGKWIKVIE